MRINGVGKCSLHYIAARVRVCVWFNLLESSPVRKSVSPYGVATPKSLSSFCPYVKNVRTHEKRNI